MSRRVVIHMDLYVRMRGTNSHKRSIGLLLGIRDSDQSIVKSFVRVYGIEDLQEYLKSNLKKNEILGYGIVHHEDDRCVGFIDRIHIINQIIYPFLIELGYRSNKVLSYFRQLIILRVLNSSKHILNRTNQINTSIRSYGLKIQKSYVENSLLQGFHQDLKKNEHLIFSDLVGTKKVESSEEIMNLFVLPFYGIQTHQKITLLIIHGKLATFRDSITESEKHDFPMMKDEEEEDGENEEEEKKNLNEKEMYSEEQKIYLEEKVKQYPSIHDDMETMILREIERNNQLTGEYKQNYDRNTNLVQYLEYLDSHIDQLEKNNKTRSKTPPPPSEDENKNQVQSPPTEGSSTLNPYRVD